MLPITHADKSSCKKYSVARLFSNSMHGLSIVNAFMCTHIHIYICIKYVTTSGPPQSDNFDLGSFRRILNL